MSLFGYDPLKIYDGRGMLESMGSGLTTKVGDIAFKSNFAYMNIETKIVERRRVDREFPEWGIPLCDAISGLKIPGYPDHVVECMYATEHRCGIKVSGPRLSSLITGNDPLKDNLPLVKCESTEPDDPDSVFTAELIDKLSWRLTEVLLEHPINKARKEQGLTYTNMVTLRGAGKRIDAQPFVEKHGLKPFMIAPTAIIRGVGLTFGMRLLDDVDGMTGYYNSNLKGKCERAAREFIENKNGFQFGFVHVKAVDDAGHDKNRRIKVEQIEKVDAAIADMVTALGTHIESAVESCDFILCVTGDHTTPVQ
jgi:2,3-diphosphopglycerate-independent phosphoglycerate mutase